MRRSLEKWPTEYKLQYGWKNPTPAPVLQAQKASSHHHPAFPDKPDDENWSVASIDGDSHDGGDFDQDGGTGQEPTVADKPATAVVKKQQQPQHRKRRSRTHGKPPGAPHNVTTRQHDKRTRVTKTKDHPRVEPRKTSIKETIDQHHVDASGSDTDSQTGQKIQPPTDRRHRCDHKRRKKRSVKRKLVWPMVTEYQSQYKPKEVHTIVDTDNDKV